MSSTYGNLVTSCQNEVLNRTLASIQGSSMIVDRYDAIPGLFDETGYDNQEKYHKKFELVDLTLSDEDSDIQEVVYSYTSLRPVDPIESVDKHPNAEDDDEISDITILSANNTHSYRYPYTKSAKIHRVKRKTMSKSQPAKNSNESRQKHQTNETRVTKSDRDIISLAVEIRCFLSRANNRQYFSKSHQQATNCIIHYFEKPANLGKPFPLNILQRLEDAHDIMKTRISEELTNKCA